MKKVSILLTLAMLICLLAACGSTPPPDDASSSSKPAESSQSVSESKQTDILYAVFSDEDVKEYPIEYTGAPKTAEELAKELTNLTGLDFTITASPASDGWIVDWTENSTLLSGLDREQKDEFFFFDYDTMGWFMMDSLCRTLTENLDAEKIYYTMNGGQELVLEKMSPPATIPSDTPYMGSEYYSDQGGGNQSYARTEGLWRLDGETGTASIEMDGEGGFTMYLASGSVEAAGYLEYVSDSQYDLYTAEGRLIASLSFDSDTQFHINGSVYLLDTGADISTNTQASYLGFWEYDGNILELYKDGWSLYAEEDLSLLAWGPVEYTEDAAFLMNEDGSSGGGRVYFDEDGNLSDGGVALAYLGESLFGDN